MTSEILNKEQVDKVRLVKTAYIKVLSEVLLSC